MAEKKTVVPAPRLKALYQGTYLKELQAELNLKNVHEVPALEKIVVSVWATLNWLVQLHTFGS